MMEDEDIEMTPEKANELLEGIFEEMKKLMAKYEVNIVSILLDSDQDDGYLDRMELKGAFQKIGI